MTNNWQSFKFNPNQPPPKVTEGADPFDDQLQAASFEQVEPESSKKKLSAKDLKRGDRIRITATGEIFEMSSMEVLGGTFFAFNVENECDRRMLKLTDVEKVD